MLSRAAGVLRRDRANKRLGSLSDERWRKPTAGIRPLAAIAAVLGAMLLGMSCTGGDDESSASLPGTSVAIEKNGSLKDDPPPLTLRDVRRQREDSPQETVMRLWFLAQWGNIPAVVAMYDPAVRRAVGVALLSGGYSVQRPVLLASRPRIAYTTPTDLGTTVGLNVYRRGAPPLRDSFLLRNAGTRWVVVYDTVLERAFSSYSQFSLTADPSARPSREAVQAGKAATARFRDAYLKARLGRKGSSQTRPGTQGSQ